MIISISSRRRRGGFTLLEVLLASVIALLLMGALYVAMTVELRQANEGRELVERSTVARGIINRLNIDMSTSMTPAGAVQQSNNSSNSASAAGATGSSGAATGGATTGGTTTGGASGAQSANNSSSAMNSSSSNSSSPSTSSSPTTTAGVSNAVSQAAQTPTAPIPLSSGVIGTNEVLIIYASKVPDPNLALNQSVGVPVPSDIRRITYWMASSGGGLCRQELPWFSGDSAYMNNTSYVPETDNPKYTKEDDYIIAKEVTDLKFEYYDINSTTDDGGWNDVWTGSNPGPDGVTPCGPPTAIRVTFTLHVKDSGGGSESKQYRHVIPLLTANGPDTNAGLSQSATTGQ